MDLARRNARTILACRSRERGQAAVEEIRAATGNPAVVLRLLDTGSLASVRAFASAVLREEPRLDVLVNNAGVTGTCQARPGPAALTGVQNPRPSSPQHSPPSFPGLPFAITSEGLEQTFTTNYLGPFLLTNLLLGEWRGWGEFRGLWGLLPAHPFALHRPPEGLGARPGGERVVVPAQPGHGRQRVPDGAAQPGRVRRCLQQHEADERALHRRAGTAPAGHRWVPGRAGLSRAMGHPGDIPYPSSLRSCAREV